MQIFAWKSRESDKNKRETDLYDVSDFFVNHAIMRQSSDKSYKSVSMEITITENCSN